MTSTPIVVLVSGSGTLLQAVLDASRDPGYGVHVAAVVADRDGTLGIGRARAADIPTHVLAVKDFASRAEWDDDLAQVCASYEPALIVSAGFMKILGPAVLATCPVVNTHPALLPSFPGAHGVRDALAYGVKVTGCTCHLVDEGMDTGPVLAQRAVDILPDDTEETLHERIKVEERAMLVDVVSRMAHEGFRVEGRRVVIGR